MRRIEQSPQQPASAAAAINKDSTTPALAGQGEEIIEADVPDIVERGKLGAALSIPEQAAWTGYELGWRDGHNDQPNPDVSELIEVLNLIRTYAEGVGGNCYGDMANQAITSFQSRQGGK